MTEERQPWEKRENERAASYSKFCVFRDMGSSRSVPKVADTLGLIKRSVESLSATNDWVMRAEAYDAYIDSMCRDQNEQQILEMAARHSYQAKALQEKAFRYAFDPAMEGDELPLSKKVWILQTIVSAYERMALLERLSRGEPTENIHKEDDGLVAIAEALKEAEDGE